MKAQLTVFFASTVMIAFLSCRPKSAESTVAEKDHNSASVENKMLPEANSSGVAEIPLSTVPKKEVAREGVVMDSDRPSFEKLDKELTAILAAIPPPKNVKEYLDVEPLYRKKLERKKDLLLSVPISPQAQSDCLEAWKILESSLGFEPNQFQYARELMLKYSEAPQLERLVIWRLIKLRLDSARKRGSAVSEMLFEQELAKFLLPAFGIDKRELFEAMKPTTRVVNEETGRAGYKAEEKIEKIYRIQSDKAEAILEEHFNQSP